ncbi:MAG: hypothetical protein JOY80_00375 [Candidatus Dormibacteraeota bacterium]|nr:hypothetical protein [Candidatus Dormibacteraeota bacterium]
MAAPGGIDPEAVIDVLRRGVPPTLDNVYTAMQRRERSRQRQDPPAPESRPVPLSPPAAAPAPPH